MKLAVCQYPVEFIRSFEEWADKQTEWVVRAHAAGANLLLMPEYASSELLGIVTAQDQSLFAQIELMQGLLAPMKAHLAALARNHRVYIVAGSNLERVNGKLRNRSWVFAPEGGTLAVDKSMLLPSELEWDVQAGDGAVAFDTPFGRIGVLICYDCEFPLLTRALVEQGAELILVPSCTDSIAGYHRVRISCQARALESQCYVAQAVTIGDVPQSPLLDENHGAAGVYVAPDRGFPSDGVIVQGQLDKPSWVYADLDLHALTELRQRTQVQGRRDWSNAAHLRPQARLAKFA